MEIHADVSEIAVLARAWEAAPEMAVEELAAGVLEGSLLLEREVKEETPVGVGAGGGLRGSIFADEPSVLADRAIGTVGTALAYAVPVELGSRPHFPPVQPLADWAVAKLGVPPAEAERVGYAIARKIARQGTEGAHMFQLGAERSLAQIQRIFQARVRRIAQRLGEAR